MRGKRKEPGEEILSAVGRELDDYDSRLADRLERRSSQLSGRRAELFRSAARSLRAGLVETTS